MSTKQAVDPVTAKPSSTAVSRRMARTRGFDNPRERAIRSALHRLGFRFRIHHRGIPGTTRTIDIAFTRWRLAVFCDGCFWHGCPIHATHPKANAQFWRNKISTNISRDRDSDTRLNADGWTVFRTWEHESVDEVVAEVVRLLVSLGATGERDGGPTIV
jgi:DNA mismatch endonuclease (patch repair protein)